MYHDRPSQRAWRRKDAPITAKMRQLQKIVSVDPSFQVHEAFAVQSQKILPSAETRVLSVIGCTTISPANKA
jgi:hypothetical protein